jgi:catechol 2,3-dioxygenase-like lactoylglutathione lyase family enzyme
MPLDPANLYHVGIIVDDLEEAKDSMTAIGGYRWTRDRGAPFAVWTPEGETVVPFRFVYSIDFPHVELMQAQEHPFFRPDLAASPGIHHVGYWVDDIKSASAEFVAEGLPVLACGSQDGVRPSLFSYHKGANGFRIELVNRFVLDFEAYLRKHEASPVEALDLTVNQ